jgi:hypothetical protein
MTGNALALHTIVFLAVALGIPLTWRALTSPSPDTGDRVRWWGRPGFWLVTVTAVLLMNQITFTVYVIKLRHGDVSDLARDVPGGWFELADRNRFIGWLAGQVPASPLLALSTLRIPSLFELPFGLLAYLTVVNWLDPRRYRQLTGRVVLGLACTAYTVTFGLIEWALPTPYRVQDLVLRLLSGLACALLLPLLGRQPSAPPGTAAPRAPGELLAFGASTAALGYLVLAMYDTALLYSLGRVGTHLPTAAAATLILASARLAASRSRRHRIDRPAGTGLDTLTTGLSWWLALFFVPALAIRYELGFGSPLGGACAGLLVVAVAAVAAFREVSGRLPSQLPRPIWLGQLAGALLAGSLAALAGLAIPSGYPETRVLAAAVLFVLGATATCAATDRLTQGRVGS